jgi:hypothetical protein
MASRTSASDTAQVHAQLAVGEPGGEPVPEAHSERRLAHAGLAVDGEDRRRRRTPARRRPVEQRLGLVEGVGPSGEVVDVAGQLGRCMPRPLGLVDLDLADVEVAPGGVGPEDADVAGSHGTAAGRDHPARVDLVRGHRALALSRLGCAAPESCR